MLFVTRSHRISRIRVPVSQTRDDGGWAFTKQEGNVFVVFATEAVTTRRYALARRIETVALFHRASEHPADRSEHRTRPPGNTESALSARSAAAAASGQVARDAQVTFKQQETYPTERRNGSMRKNLAMYAIYAAIAIGIGTWWPATATLRRPRYPSLRLSLTNLKCRRESWDRGEGMCFHPAHR